MHSWAVLAIMKPVIGPHGSCQPLEGLAPEALLRDTTVATRRHPPEFPHHSSNLVALDTKSKATGTWLFDEHAGVAGSVCVCAMSRNAFFKNVWVCDRAALLHYCPAAGPSMSQSR